MADEKIRLRHTAAQLDDGIDKANAAAPKSQTYTKSEIDSRIPDVNALSESDIDEILAL